MTSSTKKPSLESLLLDIQQAETRLDAATQSVEKFSEAHPASSPTDASTLAKYIENEKIQSQEWAKIFDTIINHQPRNFEDLKYKVLALLEYADTGHDNPKILKTISRDLQAFSLTAAIPHAYPGSSHQRQA